MENNQIIEGDCRDVLTTISDASISACITDPPYNYEFIGHKWNAKEIERRTARIKSSSTLVKHIPYGSGLSGGVRNTKWYQKNYENAQEYQMWCTEWGKEVYRVLKSGAYLITFSSVRMAARMQVGLEDSGFYPRDVIVYRRNSGIPKGGSLARYLAKHGQENAQQWQTWHSCLRSEWEAIIIMQKPLMNNYLDTFLVNGIGYINTETADNSFQSNLIEGIKRDKNADFNVHCTVKPLALMNQLIKMFVPLNSDNIVLDPFAGSGTTLLAAQNLELPYIGIEIEASYIDIINRRLQRTSNES